MGDATRVCAPAAAAATPTQAAPQPHQGALRLVRSEDVALVRKAWRGGRPGFARPQRTAAPHSTGGTTAVAHPHCSRGLLEASPPGIPLARWRRRPPGAWPWAGAGQGRGAPSFFPATECLGTGAARAHVHARAHGCRLRDVQRVHGHRRRGRCGQGGGRGRGRERARPLMCARAAASRASQAAGALRAAHGAARPPAVLICASAASPAAAAGEGRHGTSGSAAERQACVPSSLL